MFCFEDDDMSIVRPNTALPRQRTHYYGPLLPLPSDLRSLCGITLFQLLPKRVRLFFSVSLV